MIRTRRLTGVATVLAVSLLLCGFSCSSSTAKRLAVASDAIAHGLANAQTAARQAVQQGIISQADETEFEGYLTKVAQAGSQLDQGIRNNESAATLSAKVSSFLDAFNALQQGGLVGIKNPQLKLTISTIITGAETSVAIIAASVGK